MESGLCRDAAYKGLIGVFASSWVLLYTLLFCDGEIIFLAYCCKYILKSKAVLQFHLCKHHNKLPDIYNLSQFLEMRNFADAAKKLCHPPYDHQLELYMKT